MKNDNIILHCRRNIVREKHLFGIQFITSNNCQKKKKRLQISMQAHNLSSNAKYSYKVSLG